MKNHITAILMRMADRDHTAAVVQALRREWIQLPADPIHSRQQEKTAMTGRKERQADYIEDFVTAHKRLIAAGMHPLQAARKLHHLSRDALAREVGVCERTIASVELRNHAPQPRTRRALAAYFGLEAYQLGLV